MKIAFVNDSCERLGVEYISAVLKANGHQVKLFADPQLFDDENISVKWLSRVFDYKKRLISELKAYKPDLIGISVVTDFYQWACTMAKMIKQEIDVPIIFGGIHPTSVPERVIKNDFVDMVCVGEGEYPILELANSMEKGLIDYSIKNIWFKRNGSIIQNEVRPLIEDLDSLPMADKELYYSASPHFSQCYYIMASRGCALSCSYCCHSYLKKIYNGRGTYLRVRSVSNVIEELRQAKSRYNIKFIRFWDDHFPIDIKWLNEFKYRYKKEINVPFICYLYPKNISLEVIEYLKESGCCEINIGIQTWNERINSSVLYRGMSNAETERIVDIIKDKKINLTVDTILGIPGQTEQDDIEFIKFCIRKKIKHIYFGWLRYFPNTDITLESKKNGYITSAKYEEINNGLNARTHSLGGDTGSSEFVGFMLLVRLTKLLPNFVINFIMRNKIYRYFPKIIPLRLTIYLWESTLHSYDHVISSKIDTCRYRHFIKNKLRLNNV